MSKARRFKLKQILCKTLMAGAISLLISSPAFSQRLDGFNVVATPDHPFGGAAAYQSLLGAKRLGATSVAIIPFLWQSSPSSSEVESGNDMLDDALRQAIRQARKAGFLVIVKPHVWVPQSWAGAVEQLTEQSWTSWFARYRREIERLGKIAFEEGADSFVIGTELAKTTLRPEWKEIIAAARSVFPRKLIYVAHNMEEAEAVTFWPLLDIIGVSLYPPLGADEDHTGRLAVMQAVAIRIDTLANRIGKPVLVAEIGLRSAVGAAAKPWESAEERVALPDPKLQERVLADWLGVLKRPAVRGVLIWRWFTNPSAGGLDDTDFTVQGKPAEVMLTCAWASVCHSR